MNDKPVDKKFVQDCVGIIKEEAARTGSTPQAVLSQWVEEWREKGRMLRFGMKKYDPSIN